MIERFSRSEAETERIADELAARLRPGSLLLLSGPLGAGKTAFVRGLAHGLGCDPASVSSPTFTIVQEYPGRITLQHVDLYRLSPDEIEDIGLDELRQGAVMAVEWAEHWQPAPGDGIDVRIEKLEGSGRRILIALPDDGDRRAGTHGAGQR